MGNYHLIHKEVYKYFLILTCMCSFFWLFLKTVFPIFVFFRLALIFL